MCTTGRLTVPRFVAALSVVVWFTCAFAGCAERDVPVVAFLGDSLTEGWILPQSASYPAIVAAALADSGRSVRVVNAGRGGDTVAQGRARLADVLHRQPDVVVVALGVNDAIRGMSVADAERDLRGIVAEVRAYGAKVILVGVRAPRPWATEHTDHFAAMFEALATNLQVAFVPDLLAGTAADPDLLFPDGLHPSALGQRRLAANVRPALERVLDELPRYPVRLRR